MESVALLASLDAAIVAAAGCGIPTGAAAAVRTAVGERAGFPGDLYVLALAGGTGVGKSSLLNALAGARISNAGPLRPTTSVPVVWVPQSRVGEAAPLLEWLGTVDVRTRETKPNESLAVLDLPDLDSIERTHAARVDALLPKVDAVLWVTDPEKYQDAVLHDAYLRDWMRRLGRQAMVLNKIDRVSPADAERLRADLRDQLRREQLPAVPILLTSATSDLSELKRWLDEGLESKRIVIERLEASTRAVLADLARVGGVEGGQEPASLVPRQRREAAIAGATKEVLAVLDLRTLQRQAVAATQLRARPRGGGPIGIARTVLERGSGLSERRADPEGFLRRWRQRGSMARASQVIRDLVAETLPRVPPAARPALGAAMDTTEIATRLATAADRAAAGAERAFVPPTSRLWPFIGVAQLVATAAVVFGVIWLVALWLGGGRPEPAAVSIVVLGPVPVPVLLVAAGVAGWFLFGRLLAIHAGWLGRRWARGLTRSISEDVGNVVADTALRPLEAYERARLDLWRATHP